MYAAEVLVGLTNHVNHVFPRFKYTSQAFDARRRTAVHGKNCGYVLTSCFRWDSHQCTSKENVCFVSSDKKIFMSLLYSCPERTALLRCFVLLRTSLLAAHGGTWGAFLLACRFSCICALDKKQNQHHEQLQKEKSSSIMFVSHPDRLQAAVSSGRELYNKARPPTWNRSAGFCMFSFQNDQSILRLFFYNNNNKHWHVGLFSPWLNSSSVTHSAMRLPAAIVVPVGILKPLLHPKRQRPMQQRFSPSASLSSAQDPMLQFQHQQLHAGQVVDG